MKNTLIALITALIASAATAQIPSFIKAKPVWQTGCEKERNITLGFRTSFDAEKDTKATLRITGCSAYRI